ncbi:hypothetical protein [Marinomonas gallaica]|uniref:hypothetical protein n=1 Tax=Marinomonas gallaica TaxID=1806667 RepID=UPI003A8FE85A
MNYPITPDGRYMVVKGQLWRVSNPNLSDSAREAYVKQLMDARRDVKAAKATEDDARMSAARQAVNEAKVALGERGPVWWQDGAKDYNRYLVKNTPYHEWFQQLE